ncbi:MAG: RNA polymerase sporulation sigma factor SigE [Clostridiales bacterium]|nr:RNA polymerase sporulation sigma factor SigE [Clostridiales bacterium]
MLKKLILKVKKLLKKFKLYEDQVNYIGGGEALPMPLSEEEESKTIQELMEGEKKAKEKLIEHNLRLVVYISRRFEGSGDLDDLISVGAIGLIKAVNSFKPDKNIKLATYASRCIENEILMHLRKTVKLKAEVSLEEPINTDAEGNELALSDVMGTDSDMVYKKIEKSVERELLEVALSKLTGREKEIMELRYGLIGEEKTQREVADILGISQSYISRLEKKIINRLKKEFSKMV